jgi:hypothetical protein
MPNEAAQPARVSENPADTIMHLSMGFTLPRALQVIAQLRICGRAWRRTFNRRGVGKSDPHAPRCAASRSPSACRSRSV